jgi:glycine C-acetyltransferase
MGGFIAAAQPVIDLLRQRARPYLFSNALAPAVTAGSLKAIEIAEAADDRREKLLRNTRRFRAAMTEAGFELLPGDTPIIPVMLGEAPRAQALAAALDRRGVYVAGFFYPVVPKGKARIRTQMSAALDDSDVDFAVGAFAEAGRELGVIR